METTTALFLALMLIGGAFFTLVAAIGLVRLHDVYMRMHAASKAGTLGVGLLLVAIGVYSGELAVMLRALIGVVFFLLTAPVSAHLLARAAYRAGYRPAPETKRDDLAASTRH